MIRSTKWNLNDNVYTQSGRIQGEQNSVKVENHILEFASHHTKNETFLYNNRLFFGVVNPTEKHKTQYTVNWNYIKNLD